MNGLGYTNVEDDLNGMTANTPAIPGNAGVAGAKLSWTGGTPKTITADGTGNYPFTPATDWSGTVVPSLNYNTFTPSSRNYSNVNTSQAGYDERPPCTLLPLFPSSTRN